jgi:hypothetical protein
VRASPPSWEVGTGRDAVAHWYRVEREAGVARLHRPMVPIALFAAAFLVRAVVGHIYQGPAYPDSYYYVNVAQQLAAGNGFQLDYIWNFVDVGGRLPENPTLPIPSNAHWMPLASLIQVPFIWLLGAVPLAFGLPFWIVGALAAPLTWAIGRDAGLGDLRHGARHRHLHHRCCSPGHWFRRYDHRGRP